MADYKAPPRPKNPLDEYSLGLVGEQNKTTKRRPTFSMLLTLNEIRLKQFCADDEEWDKATSFYTSLSYADGQAILSLLEHVINAKEKTTLKYEISEFGWFKDKATGKNKKADTPKHQWDVIVGQDADGLIFISMVSTDNSKPKIPFYFGVRYLRNITQTAGRTLSKGEISQLCARAWLNQQLMLMPIVLNQQWPAYAKAEEERKAAADAKKGGGNGGGYQNNNRGNNNSSSSRSNDDDDGGDQDDELPF